MKNEHGVSGFHPKQVDSRSFRLLGKRVILKERMGIVINVRNDFDDVTVEFEALDGQGYEIAHFKEGELSG